ncbi:hypothetical protein, partial [Achromobacter spanius]|uniref:hypothetical protein n=1 Tax=Achromobacter spanius TaxID=217203 RepID=UPI001CB936F6
QPSLIGERTRMRTHDATPLVGLTRIPGRRSVLPSNARTGCRRLFMKPCAGLGQYRGNAITVPRGQSKKIDQRYQWLTKKMAFRAQGESRRRPEKRPFFTRNRARYDSIKNNLRFINDL